MSTVQTSVGEKLVNAVLRGIMTSAEKLRRVVRLVSRPELFGTHAIALTPDGRIVLVKLRYVPAWRLPGGAIEAGETAEDAALRELREEIGLTAHDSITRVREASEQNAFRTGVETVFLVTGAVYRARWSLEVEAVAAFDPADLPSDLSAWTRRALEDARVFIAASRGRGTE